MEPSTPKLENTHGILTKQSHIRPQFQQILKIQYLTEHIVHSPKKLKANYKNKTLPSITDVRKYLDVSMKTEYSKLI